MLKPTWSWNDTLRRLGLRRRKTGREACPPLSRRKGQIEALEPRHLLSGDLALVDFCGLGDKLLVKYEISGPAASAFEVGVYRSADGTVGKQPLMTHRVAEPADLQPGNHALTFQADFADMAEDYALVARLDAAGEVDETDETNNQRQFAGGVFVAADGVVHIHGGSGADTIGLLDLGNRLEIWSGPAPQQLAVVGPHTAVHVRSHAGEDEVSIWSTTSAAAGVRVFGGPGDDHLIGGTLDELFDGGPGDDLLQAGPGDDTLEGGRGDDILWSGPGVDLVDGELDVWQFLNNGQPGYSERGDGWQTSTEGRPDGGDHRVHAPTETPATAVWTFSGLQPGMSYDVLTTFVPDGGRTSRAAYTVRDGSQIEATVVVNQESPEQVVTEGEACAELGTFTVTSGTLSVELVAAADGTVSADCVAILETVDLPDPPAGSSSQQPEGTAPAAAPLGGGGMLLGGESTAAVVGRYIFYNDSAFDGNDPGYSEADDEAIAPSPELPSPPPPPLELGKTALLPGQTASFMNYTSYSRGINGIMVDIYGLVDPWTLDADDFQFKVGNDDVPCSWSAAPAPSSVTVRPGDGVDWSDRVTIIWADNAIQKQWLQVTVLPTAKTGLAAPDEFYFGNAIGECGNSTTDAKVTIADMLAARDNQRSILNPAPIEFFVDYDRDKRVNSVDMLIARNNQTHYLNALKLITVPGPEITRFHSEWDEVEGEDRLTVDYQVVGECAAADFPIRIYRTGDSGTVMIAEEVGNGAVGADKEVVFAPFYFDDVEEDYYLIAAVGNAWDQPDNNVTFEGGVFVSKANPIPNSAYGVHVHGLYDLQGAEADDDIFLKYDQDPGDEQYYYFLSLGETIERQYPPGSVNWFHFRTHGGEDVVDTPGNANDESGIYKPMWVFGGDGNDAIDGGSWYDILHGGAGDDELGGRRNDDVIHGDDGNDEIEGHDGGDTLEGGDGPDHVHGWGGYDVIYGGAGDDVLGGEEGTDWIYGGGGNDRIDGGDDQDYLYGDQSNRDGGPSCEFPGNDEIYGWEGNDHIYGNQKHDNLFGEDGNDTLDGGPGDDLLMGTPDFDPGLPDVDVILNPEPNDYIVTGDWPTDLPWPELNMLVSGEDVLLDDEGAGFYPTPLELEPYWLLDKTNYIDLAYNDAQHVYTNTGEDPDNNYRTWECPVWSDQATVYVTWGALGGDEGSDNAHFSVDHGSFSDPLPNGEFVLDQTEPPQADETFNEQPFQRLGTFNSYEGRLFVRLSDEALAVDKTIAADAVLIRPVETGSQQRPGTWPNREENGVHLSLVIHLPDPRKELDLHLYDAGQNLDDYRVRLDWDENYISLHDSFENGNEYTAPATWEVDGFPESVWMEGNTGGHTEITLTLLENTGTPEIPVWEPVIERPVRDILYMIINA